MGGEITEHEAIGQIHAAQARINLQPSRAGADLRA